MAQHTIEETALSTTSEQSGEIQGTSFSAAAEREIEVRVGLAKRFPRNEAASFQKLRLALARPEFAAMAYYELPAFGKKRSKPAAEWKPSSPFERRPEESGKPVPVRSVQLAREFARCWGNMSVGQMIVSEDADSATVRGVAWDLENNNYHFEDITVPKLRQKRIYDDDGNHVNTIWVKSDANEFRKLCAAMGARPERNSIFRIIGADYADAAVGLAKQTILAKAKENLPKAIQGLLVALERLGIFLGEIEEYLGCKIGAAAPEAIVELEGIGRAIKAGEATWADYATKAEPAINGKIDAGALKPSADPNRGHDGAQPKVAQAEAAMTSAAEVAGVHAGAGPLTPDQEEDAMGKLRRAKANRNLDW